MKQSSKPVQPHIPIESKVQSHITPESGQGRVDIRKFPQRFPVPQTNHKTEQGKLLQGRNPITQITEIPIS